MRLEDAYLNSMAMAMRDDAFDQGPEALPMEFQDTEGVSPGEFVRGALDTAAVGTKGMVQGSVGLPGDLEGLLRTVGNALGLQIDENTVLPTTEEVKAFFDKYVPIKPENLTRMSAEDRKTVETIGEVISPAGPIAGAKQIAKGAKRVLDATKDLPVGLSIKDVSQVKLADDLVVDIAPAERSKNFKNWFGDSKIVDDKGKPMVMYHGTTADFSSFRQNFRGAHFVSADPNFASAFAGEVADAKNTFKEGGNVMAVYVKARNPFDFENQEHLNKISEIMKLPEGSVVMKNVGLGDWSAIEDRLVQRAIKKAGFDSFYVSEFGTKNLGVFDSAQIKSAIGNKGTFNPNDPNILRGAAVAPAVPAAMQDKENK